MEIVNILSSWTTLAVWGVAVLLSLGILARDLLTINTKIMSFMKFVWFLTVLYSGPIGLLVYWYTGRPTIPHDSLWRRGWRSTAHCYSGCGMGEVIGIAIAVGYFATDTMTAALVTFILAYVFGYIFTIGPLLQEGVKMKTALWDAFASETGSITAMEVAAIGTDLLIAGNAGMADALFWNGLYFSLSVGFFVAYPVNALLVHYGVKEGMMSPLDAGKHGEHRGRHDHHKPHQMG